MYKFPEIKTHGTESRGQEKLPMRWLPRLFYTYSHCHSTTTESLLHVQPLLKTEHQNSLFYVFNHFTVVLNSLCTKSQLNHSHTFSETVLP